MQNNNSTKQNEQPRLAAYGGQDMMQILQNASEILKQYFQILEQLTKDKYRKNKLEKVFDQSKVSQSIIKLITDVFSEPKRAIALQKKYLDGSLQIINYAIAKLSGSNPPPPYEPEARDRRFHYEDWYTKLQFDLLKQSYLMTTRWFTEMIEQADSIDPHTKTMARFFINQILDALAPTNFLLTNPQAIQESISTNIASLANGLKNLLSDLEKSKELFDITRTDFSAFKLGETIACTPGQVIYKNDLMELIYYTPEQEKVYEIPLLVVPPWINKYYILDLSQKNSFVKWLVSQGLPVFLISWVNPGSDLKDKAFEDYAKEGVLAAINFILENFKKKQVNLLSYCIGGTLTAMTLAYLAQHNKDQLVNSASFLTTLIDFSEAGDLSVFIDEEQLDKLDQLMDQTGFFDGEIMNLTFSVLRANDMIWFFVVNNYLLGKAPLPFDLLYWNAQSTNLTAKMHSFYLRNMYLENNLVKPGKLSMDGTKIDLRQIKVPCHFIATEQDHIAPWKGVYKATNLFTAHCDFTLVGSGHVAGVINSAGSNKYSYWTNKSKTFPKSPEAWLTSAKETKGSWWPHWTSWLTARSGKQIPASPMNKIAGSLAIEKAPGSYGRG